MAEEPQYQTVIMPDGTPMNNVPPDATRQEIFDAWRNYKVKNTPPLSMAPEELAKRKEQAAATANANQPSSIFGFFNRGNPTSQLSQQLDLTAHQLEQVGQGAKNFVTGIPDAVENVGGIINDLYTGQFGSAGQKIGAMGQAVAQPIKTTYKQAYSLYDPMKYGGKDLPLEQQIFPESPASDAAAQGAGTQLAGALAGGLVKAAGVRTAPLFQGKPITAPALNKFMGVTDADVATGLDPGSHIIDNGLLGDTKVEIKANVDAQLKQINQQVAQLRGPTGNRFIPKALQMEQRNLQLASDRLATAIAKDVVGTGTGAAVPQTPSAAFQALRKAGPAAIGLGGTGLLGKTIWDIFMGR